MTPLAPRHRSSTRVPPLRPRDVARSVRGRVDGFRSALAGVLVAVALLVAGATAPGRARDPLQPSVGHALVDASAPSLHVVAGWGSAVPAHAPRRAGTDGTATWLVAPRLGASSSRSGAVSTVRAAAAPHSVVAAGFDATAPPAA